MVHAVFRKLCGIAVLVAALAAATGPAMAAGGVALVTALAGVTAPGVRPFGDLQPGTTIDLGAAGRIGLVHYKSCRSATIEGGKVAVGAADFEVTGGKIVTEAKQACPKQMSIAGGAAATAGGVVMRAAGHRAEVDVNGTIAIVGAKADQVTLVVFENFLHRVIGQAPVRDRQLVWSEGKMITEDGDMTMIISGTQSLRIERPVKVVRQSGLMLLNVD